MAIDTRSDADYIAKPYRPTVVQARVCSQLEVKHARDWLTDQNVVLEAPMPVEEARDIIGSERERHFDPDVVDAFLARFADFTAVAALYRGPIQSS